jgi:hypothetical protein
VEVECCCIRPLDAAIFGIAMLVGMIFFVFLKLDVEGFLDYFQRAGLLFGPEIFDDGIYCAGWAAFEFEK